MIDVFYIGRGEQLPYYPIEVRNREGVVDLSVLGVTAAYFRMSVMSTGSLIVSAPANISDLTRGQAEYRWAVVDTAVAGDYEASILFTTAAGNFSLPRDEVAKVVVEA